MTLADLSGADTPSRALAERLAHGVLAACALAALALIVALGWTLVSGSLAFFREVSLAEFLGSARWAPFFEDRSFGVLPLLLASVEVTLAAAAVAVPLGLLTAIYLQELSSPTMGRTLRVGVDLLAGVPTVVYGYFALTFVTPLIRSVWPTAEVFNWASAGLVVGLMIVPTVASLSQDALAAVPSRLREAAIGLGASRAQVVVRILVPAALPGIVAAVVLAMARAMGETMIVTLAAGSQARVTLNPLEGVQTMTAFIAQASMGDTPPGTIEHHTLFAVGTLLFVVTFALNVLARTTLRRYRTLRPAGRT